MSPSTPAASLSIEPRPIRHLTRRLKSLQHERCSPKMGQHMEYAGKATQENAMKVKLYYMQYGWWKALWLQFLRKANFSLLQRNRF